MMLKKMSMVGALLISCVSLFSLYSCGLLKKKPQLSSIAITPASTTVEVGSVRKFKATGTFTDSSTADVTDQAEWSPDPFDIELLDTKDKIIVANSPGSIAALREGQATLTAEIGKISATSNVTVVPKTSPSPTPTDSPSPSPTPIELKVIVVSPVGPSVTTSNTVQLHATGVKSDFTVEDPVADVTWSSDTEGTATVSSSGLVTGVANGTAIITATKGSVTGTTTVTVGP